jgi:hypothetical protein
MMCGHSVVAEDVRDVETQVDGEHLFARHSRLTNPPGLRTLMTANAVSSARRTFSPAELSAVGSVRLLSSGKRDAVVPAQRAR